MARRRKGRVVDGVLLLNKDSGISSNKALQRVKHLYKAQKAGHGGTLDPFADGLLPILFGEATKFGQFLLGNDKRYRVTAQFGWETSTDDKDGEITRQTPIIDLASVNWQQELTKFIGVQTQIPPIYSALKINGQRAYDLARQGKAPAMQAREITVHAFELISFTQTTATFAIHCTKGTYIRALIRDLARSIGSSAHALSLTRIAVGQLRSPSYTLSDIESYPISDLDSLLLPIERCVENLPKLDIPQQKLPYLVHGNDVRIDEALWTESGRAKQAHEQFNAQENITVSLYYHNRFLGVGQWDGSAQRVYPKRLLTNLSANLLDNSDLETD